MSAPREACPRRPHAEVVVYDGPGLPREREAIEGPAPLRSSDLGVTGNAVGAESRDD